jgi:SAM-dependent methyltransferase
VNEVIWHDVECGGYSADLALWEELAAGLGEDDTIIELGCGTGRVTLHLAHRCDLLVIGVDNNPAFVEAVWSRGRGIPGDAEHGDVRDFDLFPGRFSLALAPMQLIQLLAGGEERIACLSATALGLRPGGRAAFAIVEQVPAGLPEGSLPPLPDVHQAEGWIYSSLPLPPEMVEGKLVLRRLRQTVDPDGEMTEELNEVELCLLSAEALEEEARSVGFEPVGRREIPATDAHVGSTVVLLEKES